MFPSSPFFIDGDKKRLEAVANSKIMPLNPLKAFPAKNDTFTRVFFGVDAPKHLRELEKREKWLHPDKIGDPQFGISGSTQEAIVRRSYRRMQSNRLFMPLKPEQSSLSELHDQTASGLNQKNFVLVEESRLKEITKFENILRQEKEILGEQCAWVMSDFKMDAHVPIPATRFAVQNLCETEMRKLANEIRQLRIAWEKYSKQNHYDRPHLFAKEKFLDTTPLTQRAMKLRVIKAATENFSVRRERDTMQFEDEMSFFVGRYYEAQDRRRDYDRYFTLATRYGMFNKEEFNKDPFPGRRYYVRILRGVLRFQRLWDRYWGVQRVRRARSCKRIQTAWRCHFCYKRWYPIIRLRVKVGKRSYLFFAWYQWTSYNRVVRRIKEALNWAKFGWVRICFQAWGSWAHTKAARQLEIRKRFALRVKNSAIAGRFYRWRGYSKHCKAVKTRVRRFLSVPHFDIWVRFTHWSKYMKKLNKAAAVIQALGRCYLGFYKYKAIKAARAKLQQYYQIIRSVVRVRGLRDNLLTREFAGWKISELERRQIRSNDIERRRIQRLQQLMQDKEKAALQDLKKHLKTSNGIVQLRELANVLPYRDPNNFKNLNRYQLIDAAKKDLCTRCSDLNRQLEKHDYNAKHPPLITCADMHCRATFTTDDQYRRHMQHADIHKASQNNSADNFADFHLMLRHNRGQDLLRNYLTNAHGIGKASNCLDCWISIQDWRRSFLASEQFAKKAILLYETFLRSDANRPVNLDGSETNSSKEAFDRILLALERFKTREVDGFYHKATARRDVVRYLFGLDGRKYRAWTDELKLNPGVFDFIEWSCFMYLFQSLRQDKEFFRSSEFQLYKTLCEEEAQLREANLFEECKSNRLAAIKVWAQEYKQIDMVITRRALTVVDTCLSPMVVEQLVARGLEIGIEESLKEIRYKEQLLHEAKSMAMVEAIDWAEENILEDIYEHYSRALLKSMWEVPEFKKGMMEYAGLVKVQLKKKLLIRETPKVSASKDWFDNFFHTAVEEEKTFSKDGSTAQRQEQAARLIQKRIRGMKARMLAKKEFTKTFTKHFDTTYQAYYYRNNSTGETSWEKPKILTKLYPNSNW